MKLTTLVYETDDDGHAICLHRTDTNVIAECDDLKQKLEEAVKLLKLSVTYRTWKMKTKKSDKENRNRNEMHAIATVIENDLCVEILWSAMNYIKANPNCDIEEAIEHGYGEWIK